MIHWIIQHWGLFALIGAIIGAFLFRAWMGNPTPEQEEANHYWATKPPDDSPGFW